MRGVVGEDQGEEVGVAVVVVEALEAGGEEVVGGDSRLGWEETQNWAETLREIYKTLLWM